jgi:SAM-dependent methyltransferase
MTSLSVLTPKELRTIGSVPEHLVAQRWRASLSDSGPPRLPLVSLLEDWARFAGIDYPTMLREVSEAQARIDAQWNERLPEGPDAEAAFYDETDTLIPLLLWWHGTDLNPARCAVGAATVLEAIGARRVLDFGCGIGSTALVLAGTGADVLLVDVAEEPLRFAEWRLRERGYEPKTMARLQGPLNEVEPGWSDGIVAFDVFEHLPDPYPNLEALDRTLAPAGVICLNQVYVPAGGEAQHHPQRGEVLEWLHDRGYRLAHVPSVCWIAQKAPLPTAAHTAQGLSLSARIAATRIADRPGGSRLRGIRFQVIRHALR